MSNIDLDALNAEVQMAQQTGRKFCSVSVGELTSLLMRAAELKRIQGMTPIRVGFCRPDDVHLMMQGEMYKCGIRRKKGPQYWLEVLVPSLPAGPVRAVRNTESNSLPNGES